MEQKKGFAGYKARFEKRIKTIALIVLGIVGLVWFCVDATSATMALAVAPVVTLVGKDDNTLDEESKKFLSVMEERINEAFKNFSEEIIGKKDLDNTIDGIKKELFESGVNKKDITEVVEMISSLNKEVTKLKDKGITINPQSGLVKAVDELLTSKKFQDFTNGLSGKRSGSIPLNLKDIVSLTNNYTGNVLTNRQSDRIGVEVNERKLNIRDIIAVEPGDVNYTTITYPKIVNLNRNAASVSENGRLPESSYKLEEVTEGMSRIGTYVNLSKRMLKSLVFMRAFIINRLPQWVRLAEDFQLLHGDGQGDNIRGLANQGFDIKEWLTGDIVKGEKGSVKSLSSYQDGAQTMVEFSEPFAKIEEGMLIKFVDAPSGSKLLSDNLIHKYNDNKIMIELPFSEVTSLSEEQIKAMSFTVRNNFFNKVEGATMADAINAIIAILTYGEFSPTAVVLNPFDVFQIMTLKDTTGRSMDFITESGGVKRISGRPIIETTAISPGYYFVGDFANGAVLHDFTTLGIEFAEDVETKLRNYVTVIAQEEVILEVYNKYAFAYGKLQDVLDAITSGLSN